MSLEPKLTRQSPFWPRPWIKFAIPDPVSLLVDYPLRWSTSYESFSFDRIANCRAFDGFVGVVDSVQGEPWRGFKLCSGRTNLGFVVQQAVDQDAVPKSLAEAREFLDLYMIRHMGPSAEGALLTRHRPPTEGVPPWRAS